MNIKITSDSTCDLSKEWLHRHHVTITPLSIIKDGVPYPDGEGITVDELFSHTAQGGELCKTSAVNVGEYMDVFEPLSKEYDAVIHISIGSEFSASCHHAKIAAEEFSNIHIIDSGNLSTAHGLIVMEAVERAEAGIDAETICRELAELVPLVETGFIVDTLEFLHKGGRCSALAMLGAGLIRIKPSILMMDGVLKPNRKYRGSLKKCVKEYVRNRLKDRTDIDLRRIFITHTLEEENMGILEDVIRDVKEYQPFAEVIASKAGCVIGCHSGPNMVGLLLMRKREV